MQNDYKEIKTRKTKDYFSKMMQINANKCTTTNKDNITGRCKINTNYERYTTTSTKRIKLKR